MLEIVNVKGTPHMAIIVPELCDRERARDLRDGLLDMLEVCLATEDGKEAMPSLGIFMVLRLIKELVADLEDKKSR